jgi:hypothetical protein
LLLFVKLASPVYFSFNQSWAFPGLLKKEEVGVAGINSRVVLAAAVVGVQTLVRALAAEGLVDADSSNQQQTRYNQQNQPRKSFPTGPTATHDNNGRPSAKSASRQDIRRLNAGTVLMRTTFRRNDTLLLL